MYYCKEHGTLRIENRPFIDSTLTLFGISDSKTILNPVASGVQIELDEDVEFFVAP